MPNREPEIRQSDLTPLAFELARWGITAPHDLTWVTPPRPRHWQRGAMPCCGSACWTASIV